MSKCLFPRMLVSASVSSIEAAHARARVADLEGQAVEGRGRGGGGRMSAHAGEAQLAVQLLQLADEPVVGVDVTPRTHQRQRLGQRHAPLDHQEGDRAGRRPGHAHHTVH